MKDKLEVLDLLEGAVEVQSELFLIKEKAVWCNYTKSLFIADTHFGKAGHFRKAGIAVPESIHLADYKIIEALISKFNPKTFYFLGDLFHSSINKQWLILEEFLDSYPHIDFVLVKGNHDILPKNIYESSILTIHTEPLILNSLILSHEPMEDIPEGKLNICGHLHPGFPVTNLGRQSQKVPCFHQKQNQIILPSFGKFTGMMVLPLEITDKVYLITPKAVIPFNLIQ